MIDIKSEPELRHALAHLSYAIEAVAKGCPLAAQSELDSISELIFWADDSYEAIEKDLERRGRDELQGQEELQGKEQLQGQALVQGQALGEADEGPEGEEGREVGKLPRPRHECGERMLLQGDPGADGMHGLYLCPSCPVPTHRPHHSCGAVMVATGHFNPASGRPTTTWRCEACEDPKQATHRCGLPMERAEDGAWTCEACDSSDPRLTSPA